MATAAKVVNIFIPRDILSWMISKESNINGNHLTLLHGYYSTGTSCNSIETSVPLHTAVISAVQNGHCSPSNQCTSSLQHIGIITSSLNYIQNASATEPPPIWIHLCRIRQNLLSVAIEGETIDLTYVNLIYYSPEEIWHSDCLVLKYTNTSIDSDANNDSVAYLILKVEREEHNQRNNCYGIFNIMLHQFLLRVTQFLGILLIIPNWCMKFQTFLTRVCFYECSTLVQIDIRTKQLREIQRLLPNIIANIKDNSSGSSSISDGSSSNVIDGSSSNNIGDNRNNNEEHGTNVDVSNSRCWLMLGRLVLVVATDLALGLLLLYYLFTLLSVDGLYHIFGDSTKHVSSRVLELLEWLRGAPAGLKLNQPLTRALASFFSYHVGLWTLYLEVAGGAVYGLCCALVWCGLLGASVQVALLSDMLHVATLHLHCLYVYAARLHMVQVSLLGSQWRAFRGRKWNPLKQRVDSLSSSGVAGTSQPLSRVLTAVIFTLVVFLLPTTTVYYLVFLSLRVLLSLLRWLLFAITWMIHHNPLYILLMHVAGATKLKGEVHLSSCDNDASKNTDELPRQPLQLQLSIRSCSLVESLCLTAARLPLTPNITVPRISHLLDTVLYARQLL